MIAALRMPARRIAFAVALSALLHGVIMWLPQVQLPRSYILPPPLAARLEALPKLNPKPAPKLTTRPKRARPSKPPASVPANRVTEPDNPVVAAPETPSVPIADAVSAVEATSAIEAATAMVTVEEPEATHPLPRHAQLTFAVYKG